MDEQNIRHVPLFQEIMKLLEPKIATEIVNKKNKMRKEVEKETEQNPMFNFDFDEVFKFDDLSAEEEEVEEKKKFF